MRLAAKNDQNQLEYSFLLPCAWVLSVFQVEILKTHAQGSKNEAK
jgi:hypothetical protein